MRQLYEHRLPHCDEHSPMIAPEIWAIIERNAEVAY